MQYTNRSISEGHFNNVIFVAKKEEDINLFHGLKSRENGFQLFGVSDLGSQKGK